MSGIEVIRKLRERFPGILLEANVHESGRISIRVDRESLKGIVRFLRDEGFSHLSAITALNAEDGLEILYHLTGNKTLINICITLPTNDYTIPTITDVIPGALLHEREIHDLFGVKFEGNPDLRSLILPEDWPEGVHPMRRK